MLQYYFFALNYLRASRFPSWAWWELSIKNKQFIIDCYLNTLQTENNPNVDVVSAFFWRRRSTARGQWWRGPASGGGVPASPGLGHQWGEAGAWDWDWRADQCLRLQWCSRCGEGAEPIALRPVKRLNSPEQEVEPTVAVQSYCAWPVIVTSSF